MLEIYCDGACRNNQGDSNIGAYGVYMKYKEHERRISGVEYNTTNNKMELRACIEAFKKVKNKKVPTKVYLDSAYVLNGVTSWMDKWKQNNWKTSNKKDVLNKELWIELDELKEEFDNIEFIKVKGHSGNYGNEQADLLCNEAMDNTLN